MAMGSVRVTNAGPEQNDGMLSTLGTWASRLLEVLGAQVVAELSRFARDAGPGAMITIRRTRDGFTAQVTGAIVGGGPAELSPQAIRALILEADGDTNVI